MNPKTIKIDDVEYVRTDSISQYPETTGDIRIVILQRGWVAVGYYSQEGEKCKLERAHIVRTWGTTKGLGELAFNGPLANTKLDPAPTMYFHELTVIATMDCVRGKWETLFS
jgi:hypothetical protein